jgi:hypothetical protein
MAGIRAQACCRQRQADAHGAASRPQLRYQVAHRAVLVYVTQWYPLATPPAA